MLAVRILMLSNVCGKANKKKQKCSMDGRNIGTERHGAQNGDTLNSSVRIDCQKRHTVLD